MINELIDKAGALLQTDRNTAIIVMAVASAILLLGLLCWIFSAVGLGVMAKRREVKGRWMGWFPVFNVILLGRLADSYLDEVKGISSEKRQSLPALEIATVLAIAAAVFLWITRNSLPAGLIAALAIAVCAAVVLVILLVQLYSTCYHIYYSCTPDDAKLLTVLSVLLPVLMPFFVFGLRKRANGMPPRRIVR